MSNVINTQEQEASSGNNNSNNSVRKLIWFPSYLTISEYIKKKLEPKIDQFPEEWHNENMIKLTKGKFTRKIPSIKRIQTDDDREWLDWTEIREGKSPMQQKKGLDRSPHWNKESAHP